MKTIGVNTASKNYQVIIAGDYGGLGGAIASCGLGGGLACVVTDDNVAPLYLKEVAGRLSGPYGKVISHILPAGEEHKNYENVSNIYKLLYAERAGRRTTIFALGGGIVGDIAGFAAASYLRGLDCVQLPTTLLAQCDSSVGGKTGYNFMGAKNIIGAFHQPSLVYSAAKTLETLNERQFFNGTAEAVKCAVASDADFFAYILENRERIAAREEEAAAEMVFRSCAIKSALVSEDERDNGKRMALNFGHTAGHAVEAASGFNLLHGEALSIGIRAELQLSLMRGNAVGELAQAAAETLDCFNLPAYARGLSSDKIAQYLRRDKKAENKELRVVVVKSRGKSFVDICSENEIIEAINYVIEVKQ